MLALVVAFCFSWWLWPSAPDIPERQVLENYSDFAKTMDPDCFAVLANPSASPYAQGECADKATALMKGFRDLAQSMRASNASEEAAWLSYLQTRASVVGAAFLVLTLAATAWAAWAAAEAARISTTAANAAIEANKISREIAIADRRAWLTLEDAKLQHPTEFSEGGTSFGAKVTIKNLGKTPARNVAISFESVYGIPSYREAEQHFKQALINQPKELGTILFPNDSLTQSLTWFDPPEKLGDAIKTRPNGERKLGFTIFIGVTYRIDGDEDAHLTIQSYSMLNVPVGFHVARGTLIELPPMPFIAGTVS